MNQPNLSPIRNRRVLISNFVGGIAWGMGATVGISIVLGLMAFFVKLIDPVPVVGDFVTNVYQYVMQSDPKIKEIKSQDP